MSLGFYYPSTRLFGVGEREDTLLLENTGSDPLELFATDSPDHMPNDPQPLYGSIPYVTSIAEDHSAGAAFVNSAHTFISIADMDEGKFVNFVSESGSLEIFAFASAHDGNTNRFKKVL